MKLKIIRLKSVKSTNDEAIKLIKSKNKKPSILISEKQTKGRGTMGKEWISEKGNLFISLFFEITKSKMKFDKFSTLNPFIIKKVLQKFSREEIFIKYPNDLLIKKKKLCGILQEVIQFNNTKYLIIGIGINTLSSPKPNFLKSTALINYSKNTINNKKIFMDIKKIYEALIPDINKYSFSFLKTKICKD